MIYQILIGSGDIVCAYLSNIYNTSKEENKYPQSLKQADLTPIHKKENRTLLKNYRPVSLIPIVSNYSKATCLIRFSYTLINFFPLTFSDIE